MTSIVCKSNWLSTAALAICAAGAGCSWMPGFVRSGSESSRLTEQACQASAEGDQAQARRLLRRAAAIAPDDPDIQRGIGRALLQAGEQEEAVKHLRYACRHGVDDPDAYLEIAGALFDAGRYDECREMIDSALRLVPSHTQALLMKGRLAEWRHDDDDALEIYYRLQANDPSAIEAALRIADILVRNDRTARAAPLLRTIVESDRIAPADQARAHWILGQIYGSDHRWSEAAIHLAAAAAIRPDLSADECYRVAYANWQAGDREKTHEFVTRALAIRGDHPDAIALAAACRTDNAPQPTSYSRAPLPAPKGW